MGSNAIKAFNHYVAVLAVPDNPTKAPVLYEMNEYVNAFKCLPQYENVFESDFKGVAM